MTANTHGFSQTRTMPNPIQDNAPLDPLHSVRIHRNEAPNQIDCAVITVSDTRTTETDKSGKLIYELLMEKGHNIAFYRIVPDEVDAIQAALLEATQQTGIEAVLINGGTGLAKRDVTIEVASSLFSKHMPGFGELFRYLSFAEDIGTAAILSRAAAGVVGESIVFCMPGSTGAVRLALTRIILPELNHVIRELRKDRK